MTWDVRPCASRGDLLAAIRPISHYFGYTPTEDNVERASRVMPHERMHAAWDGDRAVGGAGSFPFELTVPGGRVRAAGITMVGVLPSHRRRGVLRDMMRAQLDACHARGEPVAYLWATEDTIYGRFGYGIGSFAAEVEVPRDRSGYHGLLPAPAGRQAEARLIPLEKAEDLLGPIWERVAAETPGMFSRTTAWWQVRALLDAPWRRRGGGEMQCVLLERNGVGVAYALYRLTLAFDRGVQTGAIDVVEAMGDSPGATAEVWRFLLDVDWVANLRASLLPVDHPLLLLLVQPRRLRFAYRDGLWVRLVDVGAALAARGYAAGDPVVIEVRDPFCPWNEGRWRVGPADTARTGAPADLACDVTALGSAYLGGFTWSRLARGLRVEERTDGAVARADALFRTSVAPWCPEIF